ncbi:hypothetical protein AOX55_00004907 (plasmid) [Sinorhizobium fredii CCBAU 25509]|nr:hypothetical protein AOX55_00004907 [Sinorhizobium fredii CCBAU 25509]
MSKLSNFLGWVNEQHQDNRHGYEHICRDTGLCALESAATDRAAAR